MRLDSSSARLVTRASLTVSIAMLAAASFAQLNLRSLPPDFLQLNTTHEPTSFTEIPAGTVFDTRDFFPQINIPIGQKAIKPENPRTRIFGEITATNNLKAGSMTATSYGVSGTRFPGLDVNGGVPPDCHMAVGPGHVVQVVNTMIAFYKKSDGEPIFTQTSSTFFSGLGAASFQFDPRVIYDRFNERWFILFLVFDQAATTSHFLIAVSDDSDPTGTWTKYMIDNETTVGNTDGLFDYPMLGYNEDAFAISGNIFGWGTGFLGSQIFVIPSADLYDGTGGANMVGFTDSSGIGSVQMADSYTDGTGFLYGVARSGSSSVRAYAFGDLLTTPTLTTTTIAVPSTQFAGYAPSGSTGALDTLSGRLIDASFRGSSLLAARTIRSTDGSKGMVVWYEFNVGTWPSSGSPTLAQAGNIDLPGDQWSLLPAISMNSLGDISVIYTRSSSSIFSDLVISTRTIGDAEGTIGAPTLLASGLAASDRSGGRWGDYFAVVIDPDDDSTFWGNGEITRSDGLWTTEIQSWTVSTGGPGGGGNDYEATSASTYHGTYFAGGLSDLSASDNGFYDLDSVFFPGQGHYGSFQTDFTISEPKLDVDKIVFSIETMIEPGRGATGMAFLYNWNTSEFEYQKAFRIRSAGNVLKTFQIKNNVTDYISNGGEVRMIIRAHDPFRRSGPTPEPFRLRTDFVKISVFQKN